MLKISNTLSMGLLEISKIDNYLSFDKSLGSLLNLFPWSNNSCKLGNLHNKDNN
jgi:hypothetical protein